jgi:5'-3' exonuclease
VVQVDRKAKVVRNEAAVAAKFGVGPTLIPDYLALVGDAQDGYPGISGIGAVTAARLLRRYGPIEDFPADALNSQREAALLFKRLATLRTDAKLFANVDALRWRGPTPGFRGWTERFGDPGLLERAAKAPYPR